MRVIAGTAKGMSIKIPVGNTTRPTSDRAREAVMSALTSLNAIEGARVLDLFAGSGALGIEALSRGAVTATFVEHDRRAVESIRANLSAARFDQQAQVTNLDCTKWLSQNSKKFDLVFCDPPYSFDRWHVCLKELHRINAPILVAERGDEFDDEILTGWSIVRLARYGAAFVYFLTPENDS